MTTATPVKTQYLDVPGAKLYYEIRGSGPVLLIMPGGPADAFVFRGIAEQMASDHTVITYDPRDLSRSTVERQTPSDQIVPTYADDVHRLLAATTKAPASILASSGGATIVLELIRRHPEQLRTVVAHEPPSPMLLANPERERAEMLKVGELLRTAGMRAAMDQFATSSRVKEGPPAPQGEPTAEEREAMAMMQKNFGFFFGHYIEANARFHPDLAVLKASPVRIVPAVGQESEGEVAHEGGRGLARLLGTEPVVFPGGHGGFGSHPEAFASKLREVLGS